MRFTRWLLSITLAFGLSAGCDGDEAQPVDDDPRRLISFDVDRTNAAVDVPILVMITVYSSDGASLSGQHVTIESSRSDDVLSVQEGITDQSGVLVSTLTATATGKRVLTARTGPSKGVTSLTIPRSVEPSACQGTVLLGGRPPVEPLPNDSNLAFLTSGDFDGDGSCEAVFLTEEFTPTRKATIATHGATAWPDVDDLLEPGWFWNGMAVGDFDGDGTSDIVIVNANSGMQSRVDYFSAKGDRIWKRIARLELSGTASMPIAADIDGDGRTDLLVQSYEENALRSVSLTTDGPVLGEPVALLSDDGEMPWTWTVGDFDGDGLADLALVGWSGISLAAGNGDGTFTFSRRLESSFFQPIAVDLDGDGRDELVGPENRNGTTGLTILRRLADETIETVRLPADAFGNMRAADIDDDGVLDLLIATWRWEGFDLQVLLGDREGRFASPKRWMGLPLPPVDFSLCESASGQMDLLLRGQTAWARIRADAPEQGPIPAAIDFPRWIGDLAGDGSVEVVTVDGTGRGRRIAVDASGGTRTVQEFEVHPVLGQADFRAVGRVGDEPSIIEIGFQDSRLELAVHSLSTGASRQVDAVDGVDAISIVDVDDDGRGEIVFSTWNGTFALFADGSGFRQERVADFSAWAIAAGDVDGDGSVDLLLADWSDVFVVPFGASFGPPKALSLESFRRDAFMFAGDFDGDGMDDILTGGFRDTVSVHVHGANGLFEPPLEYGLGAQIEAGAYSQLADSADRALLFLGPGPSATMVPITCAEP